LNTGLNREDAKGAIIQRDNDDPELDAVLSSAHHLQLHLIKETNRHSEAMRKTELGFFGRIIGGEATAVCGSHFRRILGVFGRCVVVVHGSLGAESG